MPEYLEPTRSTDSRVKGPAEGPHRPRGGALGKLVRGLDGYDEQAKAIMPPEEKGAPQAKGRGEAEATRGEPEACAASDDGSVLKSALEIGDSIATLGDLASVLEVHVDDSLTGAARRNADKQSRDSALRDKVAADSSFDLFEVLDVVASLASVVGALRSGYKLLKAGVKGAGEILEGVVAGVGVGTNAVGGAKKTMDKDEAQNALFEGLNKSIDGLGGDLSHLASNVSALNFALIMDSLRSAKSNMAVLAYKKQKGSSEQASCINQRIEGLDGPLADIEKRVLRLSQLLKAAHSSKPEDLVPGSDGRDLFDLFNSDPDLLSKTIHYHSQMPRFEVRLCELKQRGFEPAGSFVASRDAAVRRKLGRLLGEPVLKPFGEVFAISESQSSAIATMQAPTNVLDPQHVFVAIDGLSQPILPPSVINDRVWLEQVLRSRENSIDADDIGDRGFEQDCPADLGGRVPAIQKRAPSRELPGHSQHEKRRGRH